MLDEKLDHAAELTVIGKSALWLGCDAAPEKFGATLDVDGVMAVFDAARAPRESGIPKLFAQARPLVLALAYDS